MTGKLNCSYETQYNHSYFVVELEDPNSIVQYQSKMIENNDIPHILKMQKYQEDGRTKIYYDVTSKMSLRQVLQHQKMTKRNFIELIDGIVECCDELADYQLPVSGISFNEEHIFVKADRFYPSLIYIPVEKDDNGLVELKNFVRELIVESRVENTNDNFIQQMLDLFNSQNLTNAGIREKLNQFKKTSEIFVPEREVPKPPVFEPTPVKDPKLINKEKILDRQEDKKSSYEVSENKKNEKNEKNIAKKLKVNTKSIIFIAVQIIAVVLVAALAINGFFFIEGGGINTSYLGGILLAVAGLDFVLYRELFVNSKNKEDKKNKKDKKENERKVKKKPVPGKIGSISADEPELKQVEKSVKQEENNINKEYSKVYTGPVVQPSEVIVPSRVTDASEDDNSTVMDGFSPESENFKEAYLEYSENGLATRIHLNEGTIRVGSRQQLVDYVISNNRVSKVHAEFENRNGRYYVRDLNSTNGTFINDGERIVSNTDYEIVPGDRIKLSKHFELVLKC